MIYTVEIRRDAQKSIATMPREAQVKIASALRSLASLPRPDGCKKLKGRSDAWRVRVGDYRIVYEVHDDVLLICVIRVAHRREVYRGI